VNDVSAGIEAWTDADLERVAGELAPAFELAVRDFLTVAAAQHGLTAAGDGLTSVWRGIVDRRVRPVAVKLWGRLYERFAGTAEGAADAGRGVLASLAERTEGFTGRVVRKVTGVLEAARANDTADDVVRQRVARVLAAGDWSGQADQMSRTQAATLLNASTMAAALYREKTQGGRWTKTWTARRDAATRAAHRQADGQTRRLSDPFTVGGAKLLFPADPAGPPEQRMNCRCRMTVRQDQAADEFASVSQGDAMTTTARMTFAPTRRISFTLSFSDSLTAAGGDESALKVADDGSWSGPVGLMDAWSADDRMLATPQAGEIETRPLPVPVLVQWRLSSGHDGGELGLMRMDRVWGDGRYVMAAGKIDMADDAGVRLARKIREKFVRFVSLDVDAATEYRVCLDDAGQPIEGCDWQAAAESGGRVGRVYESWRVMGCTVLAHPAFPDAAISLDDDAAQEPPALVSEPGSTVPEEPQQVVVEASTGAEEPSDSPEELEVGEGLGVDDGIPLLQSEDEEEEESGQEGDGDSEGEGDGGAGAMAAQQLAETDPPAEGASEVAEGGGLVAAGLAVKALDTGRVLMLQRALDDDDPASGMWEFPGGHIEDGEDPQTAAVREWAEETGISLPDSAEFAASWDAPNGKYRLFVAVVPTEDDVPINLDTEDRQVLNPDDPDGDQVEVAAWWDIVSLPDMPALREEVRETPWQLLADAGVAPIDVDGGEGAPVVEELADGGAVEAVGGCVVSDPASATGWSPADCSVEGAVPANADGTGPADSETAPGPEVESEGPVLLLDEDLVPVDAPAPDPAPDPAPAADPGGQEQHDDQDQEREEEEFTAPSGELCEDKDRKKRLADEEVLAEPPAAPGQPAADIGNGCVRWDETAAAFVPTPCDAPGAVTAGVNGGPVQHDCGCGTTPGDPEVELSEQAQQYEAMVASAFEHPSFRPPTAWFRNPKLTEPTLATVSPEGRISGHLALWGVPHVAFQGRSIFAPHSPTNYERFHMRPIHTSEGLVEVGVLAMGTDHARAWVDAASSVQHYETTGSIVGAIRCGEDAYGIWMAGAVLPDVDPDERLRLSLATFSGDWRNEGRGLDLKAALAVPAGHEGFYTPKNSPTDRNSYALVASGAVTADHVSEARKAFLAELDTRVNAAVDRALAQRQEAAQASARAMAAADRVQAFRARRAAERITVRQRGLASRMTMIAVLSREYPGVKLAGPGDVKLAKNWVEQQGGLPKHIRKIANHLKRKGFDESHAIATAVNVAKRSSAKTGNGKACAAVAAWERMKAAAKAS